MKEAGAAGRGRQTEEKARAWLNELMRAAR